ncbi:MAG: PxKF domain-containing protein [Actinomycetes bacterium]
MAKKAAAVLASGVALSLVLGGVAYADDISNNVDGTADAVAEVMPLNAGGPIGTTTLYLVGQNGDGKNGCNLTGSTTLGLSVSSSNTSVATVSPSSVTLTSCGDTRTLTITPVSAGSATVSVSQTSNTTAGTFDLAPATFTVNVAPPAVTNTPPIMDITGVSTGASYAKGSGPSAVCEVTDAEDGDSSFAATLSAVTGEYASDGIGQQTANCSYTDAGGLTVSSSVTYGIHDPSPPQISHTLDPATPDGDNGWYRGEVSLDWDVDEPESPNSLDSSCLDVDVIEDQEETEYSCTASSAGGSAGPVTVTIKRDGTAPVVAPEGQVVQGTLGDNDWYTSAVDVQFTATDTLSGPASQSLSVTTSGDGIHEVLSPAFGDGAGNIAAAGLASTQVKIDTTAPSTPSFVGDLAEGSSHYFGSVPSAPTCQATDDTSGVDSCTVTGGGGSVGAHTYTATATNGAGLTSTATLEYTVKAWDFRGFFQPVDMSTASTTVFNTVKGGSTVPFKFEVFVGSRELTDVAAINPVVVKNIDCSNHAGEDAIEATATGGTSMRYDTTGGQYIYNWQTPKGAGLCYAVTVTSKDGSGKTAYFKTK